MKYSRNIFQNLFDRLTCAKANNGTIFLRNAQMLSALSRRALLKEDAGF